MRSLGNWTNKLYEHFSKISEETNESADLPELPEIHQGHAISDGRKSFRRTVNRKMSNLGIWNFFALKILK